MSRWKKLFIIAATVFSVVVVVPYLLLSAYVCSTAYFYESRSPTGLGRAIFYQEGGYNPDSPAIELMVRDYGLPSRAIQKIDYVEDPERAIELQGVVWSRDGSIIAARKCDENSPHPVMDVLVHGKWNVAYDFQQHKEIESNKVEAALNARGGAGQKVLVGNEFWKVARHTYLWEAFKYQ